MTTKLIAAAALATVAATAACTAKPRGAAGGSGPGAVQLWPGLGVASAADIPNELKAAWANGTFVLRDDRLPGRHQRSLATCAELVGVSEGDLRIDPGWERYVLLEKFIRCDVLDALTRARPSRGSYLRDVIESNDPGALLPATVSPVGDATASAPSSAPSSAVSWRATDPTLTFDRAGGRPGYQELIVGGAFRGRLSWWAAGDLDGDGIEDAVLFSNLAPTTGKHPSNVMRAFVLTRRQANGPVTVTRQFP